MFRLSHTTVDDAPHTINYIVSNSQLALESTSDTIAHRYQ